MKFLFCRRIIIGNKKNRKPGMTSFLLVENAIFNLPL
jgi:hypothetical protein